MCQLVDGIIRVLQNIPRSVTKAFTNIYEGEGDEKEGEGGEPKSSLPADSLKGGDVVLCDELLLQHHL